MAHFPAAILFQQGFEKGFVSRAQPFAEASGKGGAFVRTKLKDIKTGRVIDNTFNAGVKVESVRLESKKLQYLYNDGADFNFMDNDTWKKAGERNSSFQKQDMWKAQLIFAYSF